MFKGLAVAAIASLVCSSAYAGSGCSTIVTGKVLTAGQWNNCFSQKQDDLGYTPVNKNGDTMLGRLATFASTVNRSGFAIAPGIAPASPVDGDIWVTALGMFVQVNGSTVGPVTSPITGLAGAVYAGSTPAFTRTPTLGVAGSAVGSVTFANLTSGGITLQPATGALGTAVATLQAGTYNLVGTSTTDTLTNKTIGSSNVVGGVTMTLGSDATGDIYYRNSGGVLTRLPIGTNGFALTVSGGLPTWTAAAAGTVTTAGTGLTLTGGGTTLGLTTPVSIANGGTGDTGSAWTTFTPSFACGTATITSNSARYKTIGKTTFLEFDATFTALGTCANSFTVNLPVTAQSAASISLSEVSINGKTGACRIAASGTTGTCLKADASSIILNERYVSSGVYEAQ